MYDAVLTLTEDGIAEAIKQILRWRNPTLFPYKKYLRIDIIDLTLKVEISGPDVKLLSVEDTSVTEVNFKLVASANNKNVYFKLGVLLDSVITKTFIGLRFRDLKIAVDTQEPLSDISLATILQGHLETIRYALKDVPLFGEYLQTIPIVDKQAISLGGKPTLIFDVRKFKLLGDEEGLLLGANEIRVMGVVKSLRSDGTEEELGRFALPYKDDVDEGDTFDIDQQLTIPWPDSEAEWGIEMRAWEIDDTSAWEDLGLITLKYLVGPDPDKVPRLWNYDTITDGKGNPQKRKLSFLPFEQEFNHKAEGYEISFSLHNNPGREGYFVLPGGAIRTENNDLFINGEYRSVGSLSFGFSTWPLAYLRFALSRLLIRKSQVDPANKATLFRFEIDLAGQHYSIEVPGSSDGWVTPLGDFTFTRMADQRLATGKPSDARYYKVALFKTESVDLSSWQLVGELETQLSDVLPDSPWDIIPKKGDIVIDTTVFGFSYRIDPVGPNNREFSEIPLLAVHPDSHTSVSLSENFINQIITLNFDSLPKLYTLAHHDQTTNGVKNDLMKEGNPNFFNILATVKINRPPVIRFVPKEEVPQEFFNPSHDVWMNIQVEISIDGYIHSPIAGIMSGEFYAHSFVYKVYAAPALSVDGYRASFKLEGLSANTEELVARLYISYGVNLPGIEMAIAFGFAGIVGFGLGLSSELNIDGRIGMWALNEELKKVGDSPGDFDAVGQGSPVLKRVFWFNGSSLQRLGLDGDMRKQLSGNPDITHLASDSFRNAIYWIAQGVAYKANTDGSASEALEISNPSYLSFDIANPGPLYWIAARTIYHGDLDGKNKKAVLTAPTTPVALTIHSGVGKLFWASADGIYSASFDNLVPAKIINNSFPARVEIDSNKNKIYWATSNGTRIMSSNLDGSGPVVLLDGVNVSNAGLYFERDKQLLYWHDPVQKAIIKTSVDGAYSKIITSAENLIAFCIHLNPGEAGWVNLARGFQLCLRPSHLKITSTALEFGAMIEASMGIDPFGIYGPTGMTVGIDFANSPLPPDAAEQHRLRRRLLDWMEFANLSFSIIPYEQKPWIQVVWEEDPEFQDAVGSIQGMWDDGVIVRLNPSLLWRASPDIGYPNPEYRLDYDYWIAHLLGRACGIYSYVEPYDESQDSIGPVMQEPNDILRSDYRLRIEDVHAMQRLFGARPIPFRPQFADAAQAETAMRQALTAISNQVAYRKVDAANNQQKLRNGLVKIDVYIERLDFATHEDDGDPEYEWLFRASIGGRGAIRDFHENREGGIPRDFHRYIQSLLASSEFTLADLRNGAIDLYMYAWIRSIDAGWWIDEDHRAENAETIPLNRIGNLLATHLARFDQQNFSSNPPAFPFEMSTGVWVRDSGDPFAVFCVFKVVVTIPSSLNGIHLAEKKRASTELAIRQSLPEKAKEFIDKIKLMLLEITAESINDIRPKVEAAITKLLNDAVADLGQDISILNPQTIIDQVTMLAQNLFRQAFPEPGDRERAIFEQIIQEELQAIADRILNTVTGELPESFQEALQRAILTQNSPTPLGMLRDKWNEIKSNVFTGMPYAALRRQITPHLESLAPAAYTKALEQNNWIISRVNAIKLLPSLIELQAKSTQGINRSDTEILQAVNNIAAAVKGTVVSITGPLWCPLGTTTLTVTLKLNNTTPQQMPVKIKVVDSTPPELMLPEPLIMEATDLSGIADAKNNATLKQWRNTIKATDVGDPYPKVGVYMPDELPLGETVVQVIAKDASGNTAEKSTKITVVPSQFVLIAKSFIEIGERCQIKSGHLGVVQNGTIQISKDVTIKPEVNIFSNKVKASGATIDSVYCKQLTNESSLIRNVRPEMRPSDAGLVLVEMAATTGKNVAPKLRGKSNVVRIAARDYMDMIIPSGTQKRYVTVMLSPGIYHFRNITLGDYVKIISKGATELRVDGNVRMGTACTLAENSFPFFLLMNSETKKSDPGILTGDECMINCHIRAAGRQVIVGKNNRVRGIIAADSITVGAGTTLVYGEEYLKWIRALQFFNTTQNPQQIIDRIKDDPRYNVGKAGAYGVRKKLSERIVTTRKNKSTFLSLLEVDKVYGVGKDTLWDILYSFE